MINEEIVQGIGLPLVWIIDGQCLYDLATKAEYISMFTESDEVLDVSDEYPDYDGLTIRFIKNGEAIEDYQTS